MSLDPIPLATMANHEWGSIGQNYLIVAARARVSGVSDLGLRRHLRGAGAEHRHRRAHHEGSLDTHGIFGAAVLHAVQEGESVK